MNQQNSNFDNNQKSLQNIFGKLRVENSEKDENLRSRLVYLVKENDDQRKMIEGWEQKSKKQTIALSVAHERVNELIDEGKKKDAQIDELQTKLNIFFKKIKAGYATFDSVLKKEIQKLEMEKTTTSPTNTNNNTMDDDHEVIYLETVPGPLSGGDGSSRKRKSQDSPPTTASSESIDKKFHGLHIVD